MTTFKEAQNQVVQVQVESVEGEYVSQADYIGIQITQLKARADEQIRQVEEIKARMRADQVRMQYEALIATLNMHKQWHFRKHPCTEERYQYYWEKKSRQKGYGKIKNVDQLVFWVVMTPCLAFYVLFYIASLAVKIGVW